MTRLKIVLNGWDCSEAFNRRSSTFSVIKVEGPNSGVSMGGTDIIDLVSVKDRWSLTGNPLNAEDYAKLVGICSQAYVTAAYTHPETGATVTKAMVPTLSEATYSPIGASSLWYAGWTLTLKER